MKGGRRSSCDELLLLLSCTHQSVASDAGSTLTVEVRRNRTPRLTVVVGHGESEGRARGRT